MRKLIESAGYVSRVALAAAIVIVACPFQEVAKTRLIGPLYPMEALLIVWLAASLTQAGRNAFTELKKSLLELWPQVLFLAWGAALFSYDFMFRRQTITDPRDWMRFVQHAVIFCYPLLWMAAGISLARTSRRYLLPLLLAATGLNAVASLWTLNISNLSLGPLTAIPFVVCVERALCLPALKNRQRILYALGAAIMAVLTFWNFWMTWHARLQFQRTSLLLTLLMLVLVPLFRRKHFCPFKSVAITLSVFLLGFVLIACTAPKNFGELPAGALEATTLTDKLYNALEKEEDRSKDGKRFQASVRRYWWTLSFDMWKTAPLTGIGFIPEVPPRVYPNARNDWDAGKIHPRLAGMPPVSGPHNSYLGILVRMGVIGLAIFLMLAVRWLWISWPWLRRGDLSTLQILLLIIPINGAIHAFFNIGLESPLNCALMWLCMGAVTVLARTEAVRKRSR